MKLVAFRNLNTSTKVLLTVFIVGICILLPKAPVQAGGPLATIGGNALGVFSVLFWALAWLANALLNLAVLLVQFSFNHFLSAEWYDTVFLWEAWRKARDFANMFFILWLVAIAVATIIDYKRWQAKKLLPKLIAIALLVNFSFLIGLVIIDFANASTGLMADIECKEAKDDARLKPAACFKHHLGASEMFSKKEGKLGDYFGIGENIRGALTKLIQTAVTAILLGVAAGVLTLLAVMLVARTVALWLLLVVAPIAFVVGIMPFGAGWLKQWWGQFTSWAFYALPVAFVFRIGVLILEGLSDFDELDNTGLPSTETGLVEGGAGNLFSDTLAHLIKYLIVLILLIAAYKTAQSMASQTGDFVTNKVANWGEKKAKQWSKRGAGAPFRKAGRSALNAAGRKADQYLESDAWESPVVSKAAKYTGVRRGLTELSSRAQKARGDRVSTHKERYSHMSTQQLNNVFGSASGDQRVAMSSVLADRGDLGAIEGEGQKRDLARAVQKSGDFSLQRKFAQQRLDIYQDMFEEMGDSVDDLENAIKRVNLKELSDTVQENLSAETWRRIDEIKGTGAIARASEDMSDDVKETIAEKLREGFSDDFDDEINLETRKVYSAVTGNYAEAYFGDSQGRSQTYRGAEAAREEFRNAVSKMKGKEFDNLDDDDFNMEEIATELKTSQVNTAGSNLDAAQKEAVLQNLDRNDNEEEVRDKMAHSDWWGVEETEVENQANEEEANDEEEEADDENNEGDVIGPEDEDFEHPRDM